MWTELGPPRNPVALIAATMASGSGERVSGVTKSFLSRVERDMTSPSVASFVGICDALGLSLAELFQTPNTTLVRRAHARAYPRRSAAPAPARG